MKIMDATYISPNLDVRSLPDLKDKGLQETAEFYLTTPYGECEKSSRDFGVIIGRPNYFQTPISRLYEDLTLDENKQCVLSEILICLKPEKSTTMISHEGELAEVVKNIGPESLVYRKADFRGAEKTSKRFERGESFFSVQPKFSYRSNLHEASPADIDGFFHQLENPSDIINLSHIILVAEREMAIKNGEVIRCGINRPPNTWSENSL
jgi:hypothetical protein